MCVRHHLGVTPLRKVMDFAAQYQIRSRFHGPTDVSPVGMAAQLHVGLAIHNFGIQEYMAHTAATNSVFIQTMSFEDGYMHPGDAPRPGSSWTSRRRRALPIGRPTCPSVGCRTAP